MKKLALCCLALIASAAVLALALWKPGPGPELGTGATTAPAEGSAVASGTSASLGLDESREARLDTHLGRGQFASAVHDLAPAGALEWTGRVEGPTGEPVAGAAIELWAPFALAIQGMRFWPDVSRGFLEATTLSDAHGRFRFFARPEITYDLIVDARAFGRCVRRGIDPRQSLVVHLSKPAAIRGRITPEPPSSGLGAIVVRAELDEGATGGVSEFRIARGAQDEWDEFDRQGAGLPAQRPDREVLVLARANKDGIFELSPIQPGRIAVRVDTERGRDGERTVVLNEGESKQMDFRVGSPVSLTAEVRNARTNEPLAGASVVLLEFPARTFETDAHGQVVIDDVSFPNVSAFAEAPGYSRSIGSVSDAGEPRMRFALEPGLVYFGRVVDLAGHPIAGAHVLALHQSKFEVPANTLSDAEGKFELRGASRKPAIILVRALGFAAHVEKTDRSRMGPGDQELARKSTAERTNLGDIALARPAEIRGRVVDERGLPWANALVVASAFGDSALGNLEFLREALGRYVQTDSAGQFRFGGIDGREVGLWAVDPTLERKEENLYEPHRRATALKLKLREGELREGVELLLRHRLVVAGSVIDPWGNPVPDAAVSIEGEGGQGAKTDERGHFELEVEEPEKVTLWARRRTELEVGDHRVALAPGRARDVVPGARNVVIQLLRSLKTRGRVLRGEEPLAGAGVLAHDGEDRVVDVTFTGADGSFELNLTDGEAVRLSAHSANEADGDGGKRFATSQKPIGQRAGVLAGAQDVVIRVEPP